MIVQITSLRCSGFVELSLGCQQREETRGHLERWTVCRFTYMSVLLGVEVIIVYVHQADAPS